MKKETEVKKLSGEYFASCPVGLEELLEKEIQSMGIKETLLTRGGVHFSGNNSSFMKPILYSRIASRIFKKIYTFDIKVDKDLYFRSKEINWPTEFELDQTFRIRVLQGKSPNGEKRSRFNNSLHLSQIFKDGIADRFRKVTGERPDVDTKYPDVSILLHITPHDNIYSKKERVDVLVDLCGDPLSNRGYRVTRFEAPLRENLAAGIVQLMDINFDEEVFIDTMCGSGTVLIEAFLIANKIPPSFMKLQKVIDGHSCWAFQELNFFLKDKSLEKKFKFFVNEAADYTIKNKGFEGYDINPTSINHSRDNIEAAGFSDYIKLSGKDALSLSKKHDKEVVFCNPPYAKRLGEEKELEELYYEYGEVLKNNFKGDRAFILTGNPNLSKKISLRTSKRIPLYNGNIETRLLEYKLF
jgi:putative N6-adenine-specific DNA methylase